jgi:hypothetical protein
MFTCPVRPNAKPPPSFNLPLRLTLDVQLGFKTKTIIQAPGILRRLLQFWAQGLSGRFQPLAFNWLSPLPPI